MIAGVIDQFVYAKRVSGRKPGTLKQYRHILGDFSRNVPHWPVEVDHVRRYFEYKLDVCGVNGTTLNTIYKHLQAFFVWAVREEIIEKNPMDRVDEPRRPKRLPRAVSIEDMRALIATVSEAAAEGDPMTVRDEALLRLAYETGLRSTELGGLLFDDLDINYNTVIVRQGKGEKDRAVFFGKKCQQAIKRWLELRPMESQYLFPNRIRTEDQPLTRRGVAHACRRWAREAGVSITPHQIRHSYATHAIRAGIDLRHISHQLGHCDISVTSIYLNIDDPDRREVHIEKSVGDLL